MEINSLQVGQSFANSKSELTSSETEKTVLDQKLSSDIGSPVKGIGNSADNIKQVDKQVNPEKIEEAVSQISEFVQASSRQLTFSIDEDSHKQVVKVTDSESGDVIRQIPSEEVLELSERLEDLQTEVGTAVGLLFNKEV
ncbi:flagellar protein FlaG [Paraglaciecola sp.]|uniref:flagellar protein FlaG n=1 Tax=Paraglaciecola sp. TaxID=1920173 RepID=UPI003263317B